MSLKWFYSLQVDDPKTHIVKVKLSGQRPKELNQLVVFLPAWCPGSYCIRDYAGAVRRFMVLGEKGEPLYFEQIDKGRWKIDFEQEGLVYSGTRFEVFYEVYCHELTVRTAHIDERHAYLHGPAYLMGVEGFEDVEISVSLMFSSLWSKISTVLKDASTQRNEFVYLAKDYHELLDSPIEIGCQETDGFRFQNKDHELCFFGELLPHTRDLKADIRKIVETVAKVFGDVPYERYMFMAHFVPGIVGGLEHTQCTVLQADSTLMADRTSYIDWLSLVAHEYFHAWNVKSIKPKEFLKLDYSKENYTRMLWLSEGLTTCMDDWMVYRAGLSEMSEYLNQLKVALNRYYRCPGKKFHSLEESSFNAWVKLYRPNENSQNSSISYYLKGRLVFWALHCLLFQQGRHLDEFCRELWERTKLAPQQGWDKETVLEIVEKLSDKKTRDSFENMLTTTHDIDFELLFSQIGLRFLYQKQTAPYLGLEFELKQSRVYIKSVLLDGPAYKAGLNAGDEVLALNHQRLDAQNISRLPRMVLTGQNYKMTVSRYSRLLELNVFFEQAPKVLEQIAVADVSLAQKALAAMW